MVLRGHEDAIGAAAFSPDSHWFATGSGDGTARLWDLSADDPAVASVVLRGHGGTIEAAAFSPDSHWSWDGTARLWRLRVEDLLALACRTAGRNLSYVEWEQYFQGD